MQASVREQAWIYEGAYNKAQLIIMQASVTQQASIYEGAYHKAQLIM